VFKRTQNSYRWIAGFLCFINEFAYAECSGGFGAHHSLCAFLSFVMKTLEMPNPPRLALLWRKVEIWPIVGFHLYSEVGISEFKVVRFRGNAQ